MPLWNLLQMMQLCMMASPSRPLYAANCIPPSATCVAGSFAVETPGGLGCLSCFDTNVAVGPMCNPGGTTGCNSTQCYCSPQFTG